MILIVFVCLDSIRLPNPSECDLYYVNCDTLFSFHKDSELFLQVTILSDIYFIL